MFYQLGLKAYFAQTEQNTRNHLVWQQEGHSKKAVFTQDSTKWKKVNTHL